MLANISVRAERESWLRLNFKAFKNKCTPKAKMRIAAHHESVRAPEKPSTGITETNTSHME